MTFANSEMIHEIQQYYYNTKKTVFTPDYTNVRDWRLYCKISKLNIVMEDLSHDDSQYMHFVLGGLNEPL